MKALFLLSAYVVILMSTNYIEEGDYHQGEYYFLLLTSVLGMVMISSSRDLVSIFVALEFLSIPAYMLAAWRKRDLKSNEAGMKYFLLGVFASAVMLYGMSLLYGMAGTTLLTGIQSYLAKTGNEPITTLAIMFIVVGFAFKVSAVPFHTWAPDTYEGAPTPITAFLSVASKAAGFVALLALVFVAFPSAKDVWQPLFWVLAALTMTVGNLLALRQTNIVRMFAYSSVAQGGFILMPLAVVGNNAQAKEDALTAVVTYLIIYAAMNLGAFAVIIAVSRKTRSGEISSYGGLFDYAPGLAVAMAFFLFSLAGIPPLGGWIAKFGVFKALLAAGGSWAVILAVIGAVNSVIALFYYSERAPGDVHEPRSRRRRHAGAGAAVPRRRARHHRRHHAARRRAAQPRACTSATCPPSCRRGRSPSHSRRDWLSGSPATVPCRTRRSSTPRSTTPTTASTRAAAAAGRRGDFLTAPEVGPLYGAVLARAIDAWWIELGRPDPFVVVEAGAGPGTLARSVLGGGAVVSARAALRDGRTVGGAASAPRRRPAAGAAGGGLRRCSGRRRRG